VAHAEEPPSPKVLERYRQMLEKNPAEGTALDRLWKAYLDQNQTAQLLQEYQAGGTFSSELILGHLLKKAARTDEALAAFDRAAQLDAKNPLPLLATARLRTELAQHREAAEAFEKATALLPPEDPRLAETLLQLGSAWLSAGDMARAAEAWERTVALNPADLDLRRRLAETYAQNRLVDRAIGHLEYVEKNAPPAERALALQQIARLQQGAGNQDAAIAALEKALALTAPGNWLRAELGSQLIRLHQRYHRTAELEERWKKFAEANPRDLGACLQLVDLYERLGELEAQRTWLSAAIKLAPKNPEYRQKLARLLTRMDQHDAAVEIYDKLLAEQPTNVDYVFERAKLDLQREAAPAARQRIANLLAAKKNDEAVRAKALEFYQQNRLLDLVEERLTADATAGEEETVLALANFLFTQRRDAEAKKVLQRLIVAKEPPEKRAAAHFRLAQVFKNRNDLTPAEAELTAAVALQPESRELLLALGDLEISRLDFPAAQQAFAKAMQVSRTDAEREQADQKFFDSLRNAPAGETTEKTPRASAVPWLTSPSGIPGTEALPANPALERQFIILEREATAAANEAGWLRLARWRLWNREAKRALDAAEKALAINSKSIATRELLVKVHTLSGPSPLAVINLLRLGEIDPANRASYQRRAGQLELQGGRLGAALGIFETLAKANPGNLEALTDLALTQQRAERWPEALASWRQVYALSPVSRKKESFAPLLLTLERLGFHQQSAELQLKAIETEADQRQQFALFGDLLAHCEKYSLLDWLRAQFEQRRKVRADDYFTEMALGRILKEAGERAAAFEVLADASFAAENPAEALPELIREAEDLRKLDAAVQLQERYLRIVPQERAEGLEKLAQLQERNFDIDGAARTWERVLARFPRDPIALDLAIEFQLKWGASARAAELLRKARILDPTNLRTLATLADLDIEAGEIKEAEACLEQILRSTTPEKTGDALRFPASRPTESNRLQTSYLSTVGQRNGRPTPAALRALSSFWIDTTRAAASTEQDQRLNAIRELAQLTAAKNDPAALTAWTRRWSAPTEAPSETLWALFHAGAGGATLDAVEAILAANPRDERIPQAFIWLALQAGEYERLGEWLRDHRRTPSERDYISVALDQYLEQNTGRPDPKLIEKLYPVGANLRLWQAATLFAGRNHYREAALLGRRFFDGAVTLRGTCGAELARWYLLAGDVESARAVLREAIKVPADSFASPVCDALYDYWTLLPAAERPAFVENYLGDIDAQANPVHAAIATVLLRGLAGDEAAARNAVDRIIELRPLISVEYDDSGRAASRRWRFLLQAGTQLLSWRLEKLSMDLWEKALDDEALIQLQSDEAQTIVRDLRQQLCVLHVAYDLPAEAPAWIDAFARLSPHDGLAPLTSGLNSMNANVAAVAVSRQVWEGNLGEPEALRSLLNACRAAGDEETAEEVLWLSFGDGSQRLSDASQREFFIQLVDLLERKNEHEQARTVLNEAITAAPNDVRFVLRFAQLYEQMGRMADAEVMYRRLLGLEPGNIATRLALATLLEKAGRLPEAISLFPKGVPPEGATRLAVLLVKNRQTDEALSVLEGVPPAQQVSASLTVADALAAAGERKLARGVIQNALNRTTDAKMNFPLQSKLIELLAPEDGAPAALRELRRLRQFTGEGTAEMLGNYLDAAAKQSARLHVQKEFFAELTTLWAEGAGPVAAGVTLLGTQLEAGDRAGVELTLTQVLARDDAPDAWLVRAADVLETAKQPEASVRVLARLTELSPLDEQPALRLARTLHQLGRRDAARKTLEPLAARAAVSDELAGKVARAFADIGEDARTLQLYADAVRRDPFARDPETLVEAARRQTAARDFATAKRTLRLAFSNPANRRFAAIIDWMAAAEKMERFDAAAAEFDLTPPRLQALRREIFAYFDRGSQSAHALALFEAHPEIWRPGMGPRLREMARTQSSFGSVTVLLEKMLAQSGESPELSLTLAQIYGDWAEADLKAEQPDAALAHLRKARERRPDVADFAFRLSALQAKQGDRRGAIQTLQTFLALARDPGEIEQARELLTKLRPGG
jgi:tetratricopeptide (TPR) repeat protein